MKYTRVEKLCYIRTINNLTRDFFNSDLHRFETAPCWIKSRLTHFRFRTVPNVRGQIGQVCDAIYTVKPYNGRVLWRNSSINKHRRGHSTKLIASEYIGTESSSMRVKYLRKVSADGMILPMIFFFPRKLA